MTHVQVIKVGNSINLMIGNKLQKKICKNAEEADEFYRVCIEAKQDPSEDNIKKIKLLLNEKTRIAYLNNLETDVDTGEVFLAGFNTPIPETLLDVLAEYTEKKFPITAIINFWKLLMINPDKTIRESLFQFITTHDFVLTDMGYMVVYKAVYHKETSKPKVREYIDFVKSKCEYVKSTWKCSPNKYVVYMDYEKGVYCITKVATAEKWNEMELHVEVLGKLGDLYNSIVGNEVATEQKTIYTDMYSQSFNIELGVPVVMERKECDGNPSVGCSYGLHVGATKYVSTFANNKSTILVCLVNPANVVAVPMYDHSKMRVSEYFPYATTSYVNGEIGIIEEAFFENDYCNIEQQEIESLIAKVMADEMPIQTALSVEAETRPMSELMHILKSRLIDITK